MANKKATKRKDNKKNIIIGACVIVAALVVLAIGIVIALQNTGINDSYFKSDDTKYVITIDGESGMLDSDEEFNPVKVHWVYTYSGDEITGLKSYYEFADADTAIAAYNSYKDSEETEGRFKGISRDGKYVILEANESEYEGVTAEDVKQQVDFIEAMKNLNLDEYNTDTETETEEVVEE